MNACIMFKYVYLMTFFFFQDKKYQGILGKKVTKNNFCKQLRIKRKLENSKERKCVVN